MDRGEEKWGAGRGEGRVVFFILSGLGYGLESFMVDMLFFNSWM